MFALVTAAAVFGQQAAESHAPIVKPISPREQRRRDYARLSRQISPLGSKSNFQSPLPAREAAARAELHKIIEAEIAATLAEGNATELTVKASIQSLQGPFVLPAESSNVPFVELFDMNGARTLAVGYEVAYGANAIPQADPYLAFYRQSGGRWQEKGATLDAQFTGASYFVSRVPVSSPGAALYLMRRKSFGQAGTRLLLRVASFDGAQAKILWSKDDLFSGEAAVGRDSLTLAYDKEYHSPDRVHETYRVAPDGVQLTSHQVKQEN